MRYRLSQFGRWPSCDMQTVRDGDTAGFFLCHTVLQYFPSLDVSCIQMWVYLEPHTAVASVRWTICVLSCSLPAAGNVRGSSSVLSDSSYVVPLYACSQWQWGQCRCTRVRSIFGFIPPRLEFFSVILGFLVLYFSFLSKAVCTYTCIENCSLLGSYAARSDSSLPTFRDSLWVRTSRVKNPRRKPSTRFIDATLWAAFFLGSLPLKLGPIGCPETSIRYYRYSLRNSPEELSSHLLRGWSLK